MKKFKVTAIVLATQEFLVDAENKDDAVQRLDLFDVEYPCEVREVSEIIDVEELT